MLLKVLQILLFQGAFLVLYDVWLQKDTFYTANRFYLLFTSIVSIVLPFIPLQISNQTTVGSQIVALTEVVIPTATAEYLPEVFINANGIHNTISWLPVIYFAGISFALVIFVWKLYKLIRLIYSNEREQRKNYILVSLKEEQKVFSFLNYIFIGEKDLEREHDYLLFHEQIHLRHKHSWDLLWFEFLKIVLWFNPLIYLYQKRITALHEFIADAESLKLSDKRTYYNHILNDIFQVENMSFVNQFYTKSLIKKRITMMTKQESHTWKKAKYLFVLPLLALMLFVTTDVVAQNDKEQEKKAFQELLDFTKKHESDEVLSEKDYLKFQELARKAIPDSLQATKKYSTSYKEYLAYQNSPEVIANRKLMKDAVPFAEIEEYPVFPGCEDVKEQDARRKCFNKSIQEHVAKEFDITLAQNLGLKPGKKRIFTMFLIDKNGNITGVKARAPHIKLEEEAKRIVLTLPKMKPGKVDGKDVSVKYSLPITFIIEGEGTKEKNEIFNMDGTDVVTEVRKNTVPMNKLDKVPVYPGCKDEPDNKTKLKCMSSKIQQHIIANFNTNLANNLGLTPGKKRINLMFTIDKSGKIDHIRARGPHQDLEAEATRIIKMLPKMKAGKQKGKKVNVKYALPITFIVEEDKTKK